MTLSDEQFQMALRHNFYSFVPFAFGAVHPYETFMPNWHHETMAYHLEEAIKGNTRLLLITLPPRYLKSFFVSVALPAWILGREPYKKILCLHNSRYLGQELHDYTYALMTNARYRYLFDHLSITENSNIIKTNQGGHRQFVPIEGRLTGVGADIVIIDDPLSASDAFNVVRKEKINSVFDQNVIQRLNNRKKGTVIVVMQRLAEGDLIDHIQCKDIEYKHLNLPAMSLHDEKWPGYFGRTVGRSRHKPLHEAFEDGQILLETLKNIGAYNFAYQYLQGLYQPKYGRTGWGSLFFNPMREGVLFDAAELEASYERGDKRGFHPVYEQDLIAHEAFNACDHPIPANMRHSLTMEEVILQLAYLRQKQQAAEYY